MRLAISSSKCASQHKLQPLHDNSLTSRPRRCCYSRCRSLDVSCSASASFHDSNPEEKFYKRSISGAKVGSEYGEGFMHYRFAGEPVHLDVDRINENLKPKGAQRLRHSLKPDEAFGMIFNFDTVVADTRELQKRAWEILAERENLPLPSLHRPQLYNLQPERAITEVLMWTRDWGQAKRLGWELSKIYAELFSSLREPQAGVRDWLQALGNFNVPCALVSCMDKATVRSTLERMGLHDYFNLLVTAEDDMETMSQRFLSAAMRLQRPPNLCVVFDGSPTGITAAHNCTMKAVAVMGQFRAWELQAADLACSSLAELAVYNVRRLFANQGSEFMDVAKDTDWGKNKRQRPAASAVMEPSS